MCLIASAKLLSDISEIIPDNVSVVGNSSRQKIEVDKIVYLSESLYIYPKKEQNIYNDTYKITVNRNNAADICTYSVISKINRIPWDGIGVLYTKLYYDDIPIISPESKANLTAEMRIKNNFNTNKNIKLNVYKCKDNEPHRFLLYLVHPVNHDAEDDGGNNRNEGLHGSKDVNHGVAFLEVIYSAPRLGSGGRFAV